MSAEALKKEYIPKYQQDGETRFYRSLLFSAIQKLVMMQNQDHKSKKTPEIEYLENYQQFLSLYRREGDKAYLHLSRIFRRAAHKIYRAMLKKDLTSFNDRFLNLVK